MKSLLQLSGLTKSFGAVRALNGVSFDLRSGEVHALLGENGAGKSTLIKVITGAHSPDSGSIEIEGKSVPRLTPAIARELGIACIYQQPALFPDLTVAENIGLRLESVNAFHCVNWRRAKYHIRYSRRRNSRLAGLVDAGRTELARMLFGMTPADSSNIFLNGQQL